MNLLSELVFFSLFSQQRRRLSRLRNTQKNPQNITLTVRNVNSNQRPNRIIVQQQQQPKRTVRRVRNVQVGSFFISSSLLSMLHHIRLHSSSLRLEFVVSFLRVYIFTEYYKEHKQDDDIERTFWTSTTNKRNLHFTTSSHQKKKLRISFITSTHKCVIFFWIEEFDCT